LDGRKEFLIERPITKRKKKKGEGKKTIDKGITGRHREERLNIERTGFRQDLFDPGRAK